MIRLAENGWLLILLMTAVAQWCRFCADWIATRSSLLARPRLLSCWTVGLSEVRVGAVKLLLTNSAR